MNSVEKRGIGFGATSGVITTVGLMTGLYFTTDSFIAVLGGILVIAIADAMSDALGIHISTEFEGKPQKAVWAATAYTFFTKLITALIFLIPFIFLSLKPAIILNIFIGLTIIALMSYSMAKANKASIGKTIFEHITISIIVIILSTLVGDFVSVYFG